MTRPVARQPGLPGIAIDQLGMKQAVARCMSACDSGGYLSVGMINAAKVIAIRGDAALARAVRDCGMVLADGQAVVWASRLLGWPLPERVTGIDLFAQLLGEASRRGLRVYFLGATRDVLAACVAEAGRRYPGLVVAGCRDGYFSIAEERQVAEGITLTRPDLLFIGMSSPRKELFTASWGRRTGARVVHGVGGSFDIMAGVTRRAPRWWQRLGLEWLFRASQEPVRLGRRYLRTNLAFIALVAAALARRGRRNAGRQGSEQRPGAAAAERPREVGERT